ncbi:MAG: thioredoxin-disulfide reductase [Candidatus Aegiribacteria sp.]|nr:thioredoxin-disulfide reductase [Candidatus Aegiribacteria sp.]
MKDLKIGLTGHPVSSDVKESVTGKSFDVIIIGGGPAGLTSAIYATRENLSTLLLEKISCGGLPATTDIIENYPGFPEGIKGMELVQKFKEQAKRFGVNITEYKEVKQVSSEGNSLLVETSDNTYHTPAVIVGSGSIPKKLNIPGEKEFMGKGVSYCAICDGPLFKDMDIAVIGCGNSGLQEGEFLLNHVKSITFIEYLPYMTGARILQEKLQKNEKAEFLLNHALTGVSGGDFVESVTVKDRNSGEEKEIAVSGVFIYAGFLPNTGFLESSVKLDDAGYIITDEDMKTSVPGIFGAGDVRSKNIRQIDTACADGTIAAISARNYINELKS